MIATQVADWISAYERAWRSPGTAALAHIFSADASYLQGPYDEPVVGLQAIGQMWERQRSGPDEAFDITSEVVAVDGATAVVRVEVHYGPPLNQEWRDLWIVRFASSGLCDSFEEWPIAPPRRPGSTGDSN